jgi:hypothetical protein
MGNWSGSTSPHVSHNFCFISEPVFHCPVLRTVCCCGSTCHGTCTSTFHFHSSDRAEHTELMDETIALDSRHGMSPPSGIAHLARACAKTIAKERLWRQVPLTRTPSRRSVVRRPRLGICRRYVANKGTAPSRYKQGTHVSRRESYLCVGAGPYAGRAA